MDYTQIASPGEQGAYVASLVRHLKARLEEFHGMTLPVCQEETGVIVAEFAGFSATQVAQALWQFREIKIEEKNQTQVAFCLRPCHPHEGMDTIWGGLYSLIQ